MGRRKDPPKVGEAVWVEGHQQPNGRVEYVDREAETVILRFYDTKERREMSFEEMEGHWTDRFKGCWMFPREG